MKEKAFTIRYDPKQGATELKLYPDVELSHLNEIKDQVLFKQQSQSPPLLILEVRSLKEVKEEWTTLCMLLRGFVLARMGNIQCLSSGNDQREKLVERAGFQPQEFSASKEEAIEKLQYAKTGLETEIGRLISLKAGHALFELEETIDFYNQSYLLKTINTLLENHILNALILNCTRLRFVDSHGLSTLLSIAKRLRQNQAKLIILQISGELEDVLHSSGLSRLMIICKKEEEIDQYLGKGWR